MAMPDVLEVLPMWHVAPHKATMPGPEGLDWALANGIPHGGTARRAGRPRTARFRQRLFPMKQLDPADRRHVDAAKGWCKLHAFAEAAQELDRVTLAGRTHPDVLEARWQVCAKMEQWPAALELAKALMAQAPDKPEGHIYIGSTLQELGRREEAL